MRPFTPHIGDCAHDVRRELLLDVQVPLLHVRPDCFVGDRCHSEWEQQTAACTNIGVANHVELRGSEHEWWRAFERFRISFIAVGVLEEDSITTADSHFSVALRIKGEPNSRRGIEEVPLQAARLRGWSDAGGWEREEPMALACRSSPPFATLEDVGERVS